LLIVKTAAVAWTLDSKEPAFSDSSKQLLLTAEWRRVY